MERVKDEEYANRFLKRLAAEVIGVGISFALIVARWGEFDVSFWIGIVGFVVTSLMAGHRIEYFTRSYVCPRCGRYAERKSGSRVIFVCPTCNVEYRTGIRENS